MNLNFLWCSCMFLSEYNLGWLLHIVVKHRYHTGSNYIIHIFTRQMFPILFMSLSAMGQYIPCRQLAGLWGVTTCRPVCVCMCGWGLTACRPVGGDSLQACGG